MDSKIVHLGPWGYDMTLNNFYKVISETAKTAKVQQIGSRCVQDTGYLQGYEVPDEAEKNVNFDKIFTLKKLSDGTYRGKCELSRVHTLEVVQAGQRFYFNHCD